MLDPFPPWPFRKWLMSFFAINSSGFLSINLQTPQVNWIVYILTQAPHPYISWECKVANPPLPTKMPTPHPPLLLLSSSIMHVLNYTLSSGAVCSWQQEVQSNLRHLKEKYFTIFFSWKISAINLFWLGLLIRRGGVYG